MTTPDDHETLTDFARKVLGDVSEPFPGYIEARVSDFIAQGWLTARVDAARATGRAEGHPATVRRLTEVQELLHHANIKLAEAQVRIADAWDEGKQAGENFECARWVGSGYTPRPALEVINPHRAASDVCPCSTPGETHSPTLHAAPSPTNHDADLARAWDEGYDYAWSANQTMPAPNPYRVGGEGE